MITLHKKEQIEIYQLKLDLKEKVKQNPFISVLILAKELYDNESDYINSDILRDKLLPVFPLKACQNLLDRLCDEGYFEEVRMDYEGQLYFISIDDFRYKSITTVTNFLGYNLTQLGEESVEDKSYWVGEKGIYNVYVSKSNLVSQKIIKIEKVERSEDDRNGNRISETPYIITDYQDEILEIYNKEFRIEEIDSKCFKLNPLDCALEITAMDNNSNLKISNAKNEIFTTSYEVLELDLKEALLTSSEEFEYSREKKALLINFDSENLSFFRTLKLNKPVFKNHRFDTVSIEQVLSLPINQNEAIKWYWSLLVNNIHSYFLSDEEFYFFSKQILEPFSQHYPNIKAPSRQKCIQYLEDKQNIFYQTAKIETIDYLNY
jgi:hypothetical protein